MESSDRQVLHRFCSKKSLDSGALLFDYAQPGKAFYFIESGRLAVHKYTGFRKKMQVVALLGSGSFAGEAALLGNHIHQSKVTAVEDSNVLCLSIEQYQKLQNEKPELALRFFMYLLQITTLRLEKTSERLAQIL